MSKPGDKESKLGEAAITTMIATGKAMAAGGSPIIGFVLGLAPKAGGMLLSRAFEAKSKKLTEKVNLWLTEIAILLELGSVEAASETISGHIDEEWAHEAVIQGVRTILDDIDVACTPYLARVTAHCLKTKVVPDDRARRATALLADLHSDTLRAVRTLVENCIEYVPEGEASAVEIVISTETLGGNPLENTVNPRAGAGKVVGLAIYPEKKKRDIGSFEADETMYEVLRLLKRHGFASDMPAGFWDVQSGPHVAIALLADLKYLHTLLHDPPPSAATSGAE